MILTLADIDKAESATSAVRSALITIGRELYAMREGAPLGSGYGFERYSRLEFSGSDYAGEEGPDWGVGTPIFSLVYYWTRAEDVVCVTFPQSWLEQDWRALEQARLRKERTKAAAQADFEARIRSALVTT